MPATGRTTIPTIPSLYSLVLSALLLIGYSIPATAVTVDGLYTVEVPVAGSAPEQLQAGYAEGLRQVLLRVSGSSEILAQESVDGVLQNAESMLQSYQFLRAGGGQSENRLRMTFGSVGVNRALSSLEAPVWGANRPLTLAWIAVQDNSGRQLVTRSGTHTTAKQLRWQQAFQAAAARRGLPLTAPQSAAANDRELLSEVWGQFMERIRLESESVGYDLLSAVRINFDRGSWRASWTLEGRGFDESESSVQAESPEALATAIVGRWADLLAARYAVAAGDVSDSPQVDIVLDEVTSLSDYAAAKAALDALTPVLKVGPVRVKADQSTLRVAFSGELAQLEEYMALDARFVPVEAESEGEQAAPLGAVSNAYPSRETVDAARADAEVDTDQMSSADSAQAPADSEAPAANSTAPSGNNGGQPAGDSEAMMFSYQPIAMDEQGAEQAFESLYPILHYRWQPAPTVGPAGRE